VFWLGFLAGSTSYQMGVPSVPLEQLYSADRWASVGDVTLWMRTPVESICLENGAVQSVRAGGEEHRARYYVSALPLDRLVNLAPGLDLDASWLEHSPITGIHLWFDRPVTTLPHATLLDRTLQWMFNKRDGRYLQLVISASRDLLEKGRTELIEMARSELAEYFPAVCEANLEKAQVIKEVKATFSAKPGIEHLRPEPRTRVSNLYLAGDWTRSGWPATMEGAVRSGYRAAECVARDAGYPASFLVPELTER
jgi:zeta-carotene desaturase